MGITFTRATISSPRRPHGRTVELEFLIDTGAIYSVVPGSIARKLALGKLDREEFTLATELAALTTSARHSSSSATGAAPRKWSSDRPTLPRCSESHFGESRTDGEPSHARGLTDALVFRLVSRSRRPRITCPICAVSYAQSWLISRAKRRELSASSIALTCVDSASSSMMTRS